MGSLSILFLSATAAFHLPTGLLSSLCYVESGHKIEAVHHDDGTGDSLGVCQIQYRTAKGLGFRGTAKDLMDPQVNVVYAAIYLRKQLNRYHDNVARAVAAYNAGSYRPAAVGARNQNYVDKVFKAWTAGL